MNTVQHRLSQGTEIAMIMLWTKTSERSADVLTFIRFYDHERIQLKIEVVSFVPWHSA